MSGFTALLVRDLRLVWRRPGDVGVVLAFFVVAVVLFPLGIGPETNTLQRIAAGVLWCAALFAALLSLERLFAADYEDGTLDLLLLAPWPLELAALAKCTSHWIADRSAPQPRWRRCWAWHSGSTAAAFWLCSRPC